MVISVTRGGGRSWWVVRNSTDGVRIFTLRLGLLSLSLQLSLPRFLPSPLSLGLLFGLQNLGKFMILGFYGKFSVRVISSRELVLKYAPELESPQ